MKQESRDCVISKKRHSVLNVDRQLTNKITGMIFFFSFLLWVVSVIHSMIVPVKDSSKIHFHSLDIPRIFIAIGLIWLSAVFTLIVFIGLRWIPHITNLILWTFWIPMLKFVTDAIMETTFWTVSSAIGPIFSCFLMFVLLKSEWLHLSEAVLKEACKMVISVPSTYMLTLFTYVLSAFAFVISSTATSRLVLVDDTSNRSTEFIVVLSILINVLFGFWTMIVIVALNWMTISGTYAEYYFAENKGNVSLRTVLHLFRTNCRYHVGTAAMFFPLLGGLKALYFVVMHALFLMMDHGFNKSLICFIVYNIFDPVIYRIVFVGSAFTCGIKGEDFYKSMARTMATLTDHLRSFVLVVKVMELLLVLSSVLVMGLLTMATFTYTIFVLDESQTSLEISFVSLVLLGGLVFVATFLSCLIAAHFTILLCLHDDTSTSGAAESPTSCAMSRNLYSALNQNGPPNWFRYSCGGCVPEFEYNL